MTAPDELNIAPVPVAQDGAFWQAVFEWLVKYGDHNEGEPRGVSAEIDHGRQKSPCVRSGS